MKILNGILASASLSFFSSLSYADIFELKISNFGVRSSGEACQERAAEVGERFLGQTNAALITVGCVGNPIYDASLDLVISYESNQSVKKVSSYDSSHWSDGAYSSQAECLEALPNQKTLFENTTGLSSLVAFCYQNGSSRSHWASKIVAVGESSVQGFITGTHVWAKIAGGNEVVDQEIRAGALRKGLVVSEVFRFSNSTYQELLAKFYAPKRFFFSDYQEVTYGDDESCAVQANVVRSQFDSGTGPASVFCTLNQGLSKPRLHIIGFTDSPGENADFDIRKLSNAYANVAACQADIQRIAGQSPTVFGGVCDMTRSGSFAHLFLRRAADR